MSQLANKGDPDRSLSYKIYTGLRSRIISGALAPGARLRERELADELGVSRMPTYAKPCPNWRPMGSSARSADVALWSHN